MSKGLTLSEWAHAVVSDEIALKPRLVKRGFESSYAASVVADWHPTKNGELTPDDVMPSSDKKLWWRHADPACIIEGGHEFEATVGNRTGQGSGCPVCSGKVPVVGVNDLATTHPELAGEWHPVKNGDLTPDAVKAGSGKKVWWKHSDSSCVVGAGHEWEAIISSRASGGGRGCPACSGKTVVAGSNDLATTHPELAADWHPVKNGELTPQDLVTGTATKIWWKHSDPDCAVPGGHEWQARGAERAVGKGCPACSSTRKPVIAGVNDLATTHPELVADWHPTKNGELTPQGVIAGTGKVLWWKHSDPSCVVPGGNEWEALGSTRANGAGCPACNKGWGLDAVRQFIITMVEGGHIGSLTQAELYTLAQQNGLLRSRRISDTITGLASGASLNDFADDTDDPMAVAMADPEAFADHVLSTVSGADMDDDGSFEDTEVGDADMAAVSNDGYQDNSSSTDAMPGQAVEQVLRTTDAVFAQVDEEMMRYFIAARKHALWEQAYKDPEAALAAAEAYRSCNA
jgi:hypothetical protein